MKKKFKVSILFLSTLLLFGLSIQNGYKVGANATFNAKNGEVITEEVLLQKDNTINQIAVYEEGLNPYHATSKSTLLSNLKVEEIEQIKDNGYTLLITGKQDNVDLPQPVVVEGKTIEVSIYSNDEEVLKVVKNLIN